MIVAQNRDQPEVYQNSLIEQAITGLMVHLEKPVAIKVISL